MNIKDQINIGNDILNNIFQFMDKYFLDDLPNSPQKLLKYAKRRVSPFIASYICDSLKNKMLASRMTDEEYLLFIRCPLRVACHPTQTDAGEKARKVP